MRNLLLFNPSHDLALANGSLSYMSPDSSRRFANDLSYLPAWYERYGDVLVPRGFHWHAPLQLSTHYITIDRVAQQQYDRLIPWGWNNAMCKQLVDLKISPELLYRPEQLEAIRMLSHRNISRQAMLFMQDRFPMRVLPEPATLLESCDEVSIYVSSHKRVVLKAPWSGSGKGIFFTERPISESLMGWCRRILFKQKGVMGETALEKVQDFAMEFYVGKQGTVFAGYSLFFSEHSGIYRCNQLLSDTAIVEHLSMWIDPEELKSYIEAYRLFLDEYVQPHYHGYVGVDMMVYKDEGEFKINPAVELNIRITMGLVARRFYDNYMVPGSKGWFYIDHVPHGLQDDHLQRQIDAPLTIENNHIVGGYLSLCPILRNTTYRARVEVEPDEI